jgi:hypothetical protein
LGQIDGSVSVQTSDPVPHFPRLPVRRKRAGVRPFTSPVRCPVPTIDWDPELVTSLEVTAQFTRGRARFLGRLNTERGITRCGVRPL